jgi:hypothetical protein
MEMLGTSHTLLVDASSPESDHASSFVQRLPRSLAQILGRTGAWFEMALRRGASTSIARYQSPPTAAPMLPSDAIRSASPIWLADPTDQHAMARKAEQTIDVFVDKLCSRLGLSLSAPYV